MTLKNITIVGIGPGSIDYVTPIARRKIEESDVLMGSERALALFAELEKEKIPLKGSLQDFVKIAKDKSKEKKVAVLVTGDPGLYSLLQVFSKEMDKGALDVIPGISVVQVAYARLGESWHDAKIISLHGREPFDLVEKVKSSENIFLYTGPEFPPDKIAEFLLNNGVENRRAIVMENLTYSNEKIIDSDLKNIAKQRGFGLCVMIIKGEAS
ncbi:MAG: precorrin-6y C5,15-methyltransferase (decarboxylating) subunit CbiE [Desulfobacterota bacterium]|nr:precorrin-6y C5,15-methyltransferase (decarboxylating) subunit CbiE [Thermodesulfobacteriota bacterium]MDW8001282.1 precorrin-6y C5,15-methyltransferase (decarboxylating) subunit CbiE [Deltaproteobacteria bacterium]